MEKILLRQIATLQGHIIEQVKVLNLCKEIVTSTFYDRDSLYIPHTKNSPSMFTPLLLRKKELFLETRSLLCTINQSFYSGNMPQMQTEIEQNRCAMACQGYGTAIYFFLKKAVDSFL